MTSSEDNTYGGRRYMAYVFTEQGIAMLSVVLKGDIAVEVSIKIMNVFVEIEIDKLEFIKKIFLEGRLIIWI